MASVPYSVIVSDGIAPDDASPLLHSPSKTGVNALSGEMSEPQASGQGIDRY